MGLRDLENRFYARLRDPGSAQTSAEAPLPWEPAGLRPHAYCLLTSFRMSGVGVPTPVWFGPAGDLIYIRSGRQDGKVKRIRREPRVLIAPCTVRGRPLGPAMEGHARVVADPAEAERAEAALRSHYGAGRRLYRVLRRRSDAVYLAVGPRPRAI